MTCVTINDKFCTPSSASWGQERPERVLLHFDGVKVSLGARQGGRRVEHLAASVTGLGREIKLGIFEVENGTGTRFYILQFFLIMRQIPSRSFLP